MSLANRSSGSSATIKILTFPAEYSKFDVKRSQCPFRDVTQRKPSPVTSINLGVPPIMSIRKPKSKLCSLNPTFSSGSHSKVVAMKSTNITTSRTLTDTKHRKSVKLGGSAFVLPCPDSIVLGAPKPFLGNCRHIDNNKKLFSLTEDPRKRFCLRNPNVLHFKPIPLELEQIKIRELVKTADNLVTPSGSQSTLSSICEVIDLANPLNLDFQGLDYKNTYQKDEQSCQNQMEYRKVRRFQHRRNVKAETVMFTEKEQQEERIAIPKYFAPGSPTIEQGDVLLPESGEGGEYFGKLVRAEEKPEVRLKLEKEDQNRRDRYKRLYLHKKEQMAKNKDVEKAIQEITAENKAKVLAKTDIDDLVGLLDRTITTKKRALRQIPKRRNFPHTIWETLKFRHHLKKSKRILRDRAKVKQSFYAKMGKLKTVPEAQLEISSDSASPSPRNDEQSTNDEDDLNVGQQGSKFMLRGFHYKLGSNLRGKFHQKELADGERNVKGCITRAEWFESLVSRKKTAHTKASKLLPGMDLFPKPVGFQQPVAQSPIKEFRRKPIGGHYDRVVRKNLRIKKPKQINVRKFNLIGYLYGIEARKKIAQSVSRLHENALNGQIEEYIHNKAKIDMFKKRVQKRRRMHYLGIPCPKRQRVRSKSICVDSDSKDSEWIPDDLSEDRLSPGSPDIQKRGNMPAPEYRETTLCRHLRHPRNYKELRVPSAQFDKFVQEQGIPIMEKVTDDKKVIENVGVINNTEYARKFEARHHHDHWNPTQHKTIHVRYATKVVKPKPIEGGSKGHSAKQLMTFGKSRPIGYNVEEIDFSMIRLKTDELKKEYHREAGPSVKSKSRLAKTSLDPPKIFHSMEEGDLQQFPGRDKFLNFIREIRLELDKRGGHTDTELVIDKTAYLCELKEDLRSIESCLSSLSSSECTNLSNDSGSFLMAGDKKIPLDYIRKPLVPFEQINRSRFEAVPIDAAKETLNPYRTVPFAGQQKVQLNMSAANDSFFTFNTRLQNGLRLRLEVNTEDPRKRLIGRRGGAKANAQVATDIDELYIEDLRKRPALKPFKWNSCRTMIKDALRKKFESMLIQGEIVRTKICDRQNENDFQQMSQMKELFKNLFAKWEKKEYDSAMEVVHKVKPYYEATDKYRSEAEELGKRYTVLNMEIVYIENDWMRRTILQNFHYLLADMEWRIQHDWIHRDVDREIEGFKESIAKRSTTNIRKRDKDDAWAIKEYFDNVYSDNCHPIIIVFETARDFINGIENLKSKTFVLLLELHYTLWILAELSQKYEEFSDWCVIELESRKRYAENKCANKYFMENRAKQLKAQVKGCLGRPIDVTFSDKRFSEMKGICNEVYTDILPASSQIVMSPMEQVAAVSQVLTDLLGKFEGISVDHRQNVEKKYRRLLEYRRNMSKQAVLVERRIASEMVKVRHNLAPPFQKARRGGTLPRSELKKVVRTIPQKRVKISEKTKFFYKAFHEEGDLKGLKEARESLDVMDDIQESIVPFYFDHFLRINGYQPNYNFKTEVELRDGPEIERFQVKHVLPEVLEKFEKWQVMKKRIMEENINKNPEMYQNVQI